MSRTDLEIQFKAVANTHRRRLLIALHEHNSQRTDEAISENLQAGDAERDELEAQFYHNHLPRLDVAGFITWNQESNEITKGPNFDDIRPLLEVLESHYNEVPNTST
jgi:hypothetical protein